MYVSESSNIHNQFTVAIAKSYPNVDARSNESGAVPEFMAPSKIS